MTRRYAKRYACIVCGEPTGRPGTRCPACSATHRRERMQTYLVAYHDRTRPAPAPTPQINPELPPFGALIYSDDGLVQCHVCARFFGSLVTHIRPHGLDAESYKDRYGLARSASLLGPAAQAKQRAAALARHLGDAGRVVIAEIGPHPRARGIDNRRQSRINVSDGHRAKRASRVSQEDLTP